jgi:hypothetical protein
MISMAFGGAHEAAAAHNKDVVRDAAESLESQPLPPAWRVADAVNLLLV